MRRGGPLPAAGRSCPPFCFRPDGVCPPNDLAPYSRARFVSGTSDLEGGARDLLDIVHSKAGVPVRLTDERWAHISEEHEELVDFRLEVLETIANPVRIYAGGAGELLAAREIEAGKWLVAVYRELGDDGFVITAFLTRRITALERRKQLWP